MFVLITLLFVLCQTYFCPASTIATMLMEATGSRNVSVLEMMIIALSVIMPMLMPSNTCFTRFLSAILCCRCALGGAP